MAHASLPAFFIPLYTPSPSLPFAIRIQYYRRRLFACYLPPPSLGLFAEELLREAVDHEKRDSSGKGTPIMRGYLPGLSSSLSP